MIQFYAPDLRNSMCLTPEESAHCAKVLRKKSGDIIFVTDGKGFRFECEITKADAKKVEVIILNEVFIKKSWKGLVTIAVAPTKNADRMSWLVEKATELGVDKIIFISCRNSERKNVNIERLRKNAISAMNQSLKTFLPELEGITKLDQILDIPGYKFFGYCLPNSERSIFAKDYLPSSDVVVAIGPEGDFSEDEVKILIQCGYKPVTFGDERLRTETAALYAIASIHVVDSLVVN